MILSRVKISPQQRYDLEDFLAGQAAARADSKLWTQKFLAENNMVLGGFTVSGIGLKFATVAMANAALMIPQSTFDFSYFISAPSDPDIVLTDAVLVDGVRNYIEAQLTTLDGTPLVKAFWDAEANSGNGAEFNQIVNTITDIRISFSISTGGFSGSPDKLPIAIIDTDGTGVIKVILDRRELFGRLAKPSNLDNQYAWGTKQEPVYQLTLSGVSGTFLAGESLSVNSETAKCVTGGSTSITFNEPTGINFSNGDAVTGLTSGATGVVNTVFESFLGVDKTLKGQKSINDALMTEIKLMKNTRFWWESAPSLGGMKQEIMSTIAPLTSGAKISWDGAKVTITDNSLTPSDSDSVAAIRLLSSPADLILKRQDNGKEITTISLSDVPTIGILTLDQDGNSVAINWNDNTAAIQSTWNSSGAYAATIFGSPIDGKITIVAAAAGIQVDISETSNTLSKASTAVTATYVVKQGKATDLSISLSDGQILYVDIAQPAADTNYSVVGSGASNYKVTDRGSIALVDSSYWLAYREGSKLIWRFSGELTPGESIEVSDQLPEALKVFLGFDPETATSVPYTAFPNENLPAEFTEESSLVKAISADTENLNYIADILNKNPYEERMDVIPTTPSSSNEIQGPVSPGTVISIPLDSRDGSSTESYVVGRGQIQVWLNGVYLDRSTDNTTGDYAEVGSTGNTSSNIEILIALEIGDKLVFRNAQAGGISGTSSGAQSLQDTYTNGNTISTTSGRPMIVGGVADKVAQFNGDIGVTGVIDPKGMTLIPQSSNPLEPTDNGIWVNASGELIQSRPSLPDVNITNASAGTSSTVNRFTLTPTDITNKFVTLTKAPAVPSDTILSVVGGCDQDYSSDFTISGSVLSWTGLGLDGILSSGDKLIVLINA